MNPFVAAQIMPIVAAQESTSMSGILGQVTTFLTWALTSITSVVSWVVGDGLAMVYVSMFIIGFVVAYLFRILHTC